MEEPRVVEMNEQELQELQELQANSKIKTEEKHQNEMEHEITIGNENENENEKKNEELQIQKKEKGGRRKNAIKRKQTFVAMATMKFNEMSDKLKVEAKKVKKTWKKKVKLPVTKKTSTFQAVIHQIEFILLLSYTILAMLYRVFRMVLQMLHIIKRDDNKQS